MISVLLVVQIICIAFVWIRLVGAYANKDSCNNLESVVLSYIVVTSLMGVVWLTCIGLMRMNRMDVYTQLESKNSRVIDSNTQETA